MASQFNGKQIKDSTISQSKLNLTTPVDGNNAATKFYVDSGITSLSTAINNISTTSLSTALSSEIVTRSSADTSLSTALSAEVSGRTTADANFSTILTNEITARMSTDASLSTAISGEIVTRNSSDVSLSTAISSKTSSIVSLSTAISTEVYGRTSADSSLEYLITNHNHSALYQPNGTNPFVYTDDGGTLHIDGDIVQSGTTYITHAEQIYTTKNYIYLRSGATAGLSNGEYAGFEAIKYDGVNNGRLVFDSGGTARVGDIGCI